MGTNNNKRYQKLKATLIWIAFMVSVVKDSLDVLIEIYEHFFMK